MVKRIIKWFDGWWTKKQCGKETLPDENDVTLFCWKNEGHFGKHETYTKGKF